MTPTEATGETRVELYVRESLPAPAERQRAAVTDRLDALEAVGQIDAYERSTWPKRVRKPTEHPTPAGDLYREFRAWAKTNDRTLQPFFDTRYCYSMTTGDRETWVVLPALCLAIYEDETLQFVYPHATDDECLSVGDALDALETPDDHVEPRDSTTTIGTAD